MLADDSGAGTVQVVALVAVVVVLCGALGAAASGHRARLTARTAADLAALAAAEVVALPPGLVDLSGAGDPCVRAVEVAARNGARVTRCDVAGTTVSVTAATGSALGPGVATAFAGPRPSAPPLPA